MTARGGQNSRAALTARILDGVMAGRFLLTSLLLLMASAVPGCAIMQTGVRNPVPGLETVAIVPFFNLSQDRSVDGREFALAYYSELQKVQGFEVLPVGVAERAIQQHGLTMSGPEDALKLAAILQVDAVVIGSITDHDPYLPRVGLKVAWYSPEQWLFLPEEPEAVKKASQKITSLTRGNRPGEKPAYGSIRGQSPDAAEASGQTVEEGNWISLVDQAFQSPVPTAPAEDLSPDSLLAPPGAAASDAEALSVAAEDGRWEQAGAAVISTSPAPRPLPATRRPPAPAGNWSQTVIHNGSGTAGEPDHPVTLQSFLAEPQAARAVSATGHNETPRDDASSLSRITLPAPVTRSSTLPDRSASPSYEIIRDSAVEPATGQVPAPADPSSSTAPGLLSPATPSDPAPSTPPVASPPAPGIGLQTPDRKPAPRTAPAEDQPPPAQALPFTPPAWMPGTPRLESAPVIPHLPADRTAVPQNADERTVPALIYGDRVLTGSAEFDPGEPLMAYVRLFDSTDQALVSRLSDYLELSGETRSGDLEAWMKRSDFFRKFTAYLMINEMLTLHGGEAHRRLLLKPRKYR